MSENVLHIYVVFFNPSDYPGKYVVRLFLNNEEPTETFWIAETLEQARLPIPKGLYCIPRHPKDDPVIIETWI